MVAHLTPYDNAGDAKATDIKAAAFTPEHCPSLVVKIGSSLLVDDDGNIRAQWLETLCDDIAARIASGQHIIIISSGAIALGARRLGFSKGGRASLADAQAAAAVGQIMLSGLWSQLLEKRGILSGQLLLTLDDMEDRRRYLNAVTTLQRLAETGAVPVVNENDSVATEEIRFGDNDRLAASVAQAVRADGLILMSDVDGLYSANPADDPAAKRYELVRAIDDSITALADDKHRSAMGTGGMGSKLIAAKMATETGVITAIISGTYAHPLRRLDHGHAGTVFMAQTAGAARKTWLAGRKAAAGTLVIDSGAAQALSEGASLLAAGITAIKGAFHRGDLVAIADHSGAILAQGLAEYDAAAVKTIMGRRSDEHENLLGHAPRRAVVHRDHMVLL